MDGSSAPDLAQLNEWLGVRMEKLAPERGEVILVTTPADIDPDVLSTISNNIADWLTFCRQRGDVVVPVLVRREGTVIELVHIEELVRRAQTGMVRRP
jgi:hypothetical protein